jgi:YidC/Oxa1 family membrane protein insertase
MEIINQILGVPLGFVMYWCYQVIGSYGWAIILFTLLTKVILFPLSLIAQKNSIKMVRMAPLLEEIKRSNVGNGELIIQEQKALYRQEGYSSFAGILPLLIQIPIILGLINVIYNPLEHLFHFDAATIGPVLERAIEVLSMPRAEMGFGAQLFALEAVKSNPEAFMTIPGISQQVQSMVAFDTSFFGIDLSAVPALTSLTVSIPIASGASALALSLFQNRYNVLQLEQGFIAKWGMTIFLIVFSAYFAAVLPCGLGLYWTAGNLLSIPVLALCNVFYNPEHYIDYANRATTPQLSRAERAERRRETRELRARSRACTQQFFAADTVRELVIYSEASGFYKYFSGTIDYLIENSDITIHYVTSDPKDRIFARNEPRIKAWFIDSRDLIAFFLKLDADMVLMTMPDLDTYHIKRSIVRDDVEYVYLDHGMTSFHLMLREGALDHFDTIFAYGPNHIEEIRQLEAAYGLPKKTLVQTGYGLLDEMRAEAAALVPRQAGTDVGADAGTDAGAAAGADAGAAVGAAVGADTKKQILIAPSWQKDNLMDLCLDDLLTPLLATDYRVVLRPHPEFIKRFPAKVDALLNRYRDHLGTDFLVETDFSSNETVYASAVVITDWSSIAMEFSYATGRPSLFINTPMKVMNPAYQRIEAVPLDISLRDRIGRSVEVDELDTIVAVIEDLTRQPEAWSERIAAVVRENIYDTGNASKGGGTYIISRIEYQRSLRAYRQNRRSVGDGGNGGNRSGGGAEGNGGNRGGGGAEGVTLETAAEGGTTL